MFSKNKLTFFFVIEFMDFLKFLEKTPIPTAIFINGDQVVNIF